MLATKAVAETNACTYPGRTVKIPTEAEVSERRIRPMSRAAKLFCPLPNPIDHSRHFVVGIYSEGQPEHRHEYEYIKRNRCWTLLRSRSAGSVYNPRRSTSILTGGASAAGAGCFVRVLSPLAWGAADVCRRGGISSRIAERELPRIAVDAPE